MLAIAAQISSAEIGGGYFQETHPQNLFRECSHYCELVSDPAQLPYVLENAIRAAVGQRGVAVMVIPGDVALRPAPKRAISPIAGLLPAPPVVRPAEREVTDLADLLNGARRVTLFCGRGCAGAHEGLMKLAETLKSPIVHALGGKEHVEFDNPYDVGMTGFIGFSSGYAAMHACDVLLMLGTDFPYKQFLPSDAKIAQVDIRQVWGSIGIFRSRHHGRHQRHHCGVAGEAGGRRAIGEHLDASLAHYKTARAGLDELARGTPGYKPIHPQYLTKLIERNRQRRRDLYRRCRHTDHLGRTLSDDERQASIARLVQPIMARWRTRCHRRSAHRARIRDGRSCRSRVTADCRCCSATCSPRVNSICRSR